MTSSSSQPPPDDPNDPYRWKRELPIGIKFRPTDEELILSYLRVKFMGQPITPGIISFEEVYKYPPELLRDKAFEHDDGRMYFFTFLKRKDNSIKKSERLVKDIGFWKATQARTRFPDEKNHIGTKTPLTYYHYSGVLDRNGKRVATKQNWLMTEYRLPEDESQADGELALCVVYYHYNPKKN